MNKYRRHILIGVPGLILYFLLLSQLIGAVSENNKKLRNKQSKLYLYSSGEAHYNYCQSLKKYISKRLDSYKEFKTVSEGITNLLSLVKTFNLNTKSIFHSTIRETENISYITVDLELSGKYSDLCFFLQKLNLEAYRIEKLKISSTTTGISAYLRIRLFLSENVDK
jgi:hypothetical protein